MTDDPMVVTVREEAELADGRVPRTLLDRPPSCPSPVEGRAANPRDLETVRDMTTNIRRRAVRT